MANCILDCFFEMLLKCFLSFEKYKNKLRFLKIKIMIAPIIVL